MFNIIEIVPLSFNSYFNQLNKTMNTSFTKKILRLSTIVAGMLVAIAVSLPMKAEINRYEFDFTYQRIEYLIVSESERTVAVAQPWDIDSGGMADGRKKAWEIGYGIGPEGFLMGNGLFGPIVNIPSTVYNEDGTAYTVTDLASEAINWVRMSTLILPPTLKNLNYGIMSVFGLNNLYLPDGLKKIDGISNCKKLKTLHIPSSVEVIGQHSLTACGFKNIYLPPAVKTMEKNVLSYCDSLRYAMLSQLQSMGNDCFKKCTFLLWANLPESLKSMGEGCFNDCTDLELVSLPWSDIKMDGCFNGCPAISRIEVLATEPNPFPEGSFLDVDRSTCELGVPMGSADKYRQAEGWKDFARIVDDLPAVTPSGTAVLPTPDFRAFGEKGCLRIFSPSEGPIDVFAISGEKAATVSKSGVNRVQLPAGVYIVSSPFGSHKVAVK